ncbi:MAG: hypothetical protein ACK4YF_04475 [Exilispira sp.]
MKLFNMKIFKRKKIIDCKYCGKSLRIPYLKGKTIRVICPYCTNKFEVIFPD